MSLHSLPIIFDSKNSVVYEIKIIETQKLLRLKLMFRVLLRSNLDETIFELAYLTRQNKTVSGWILTLFLYCCPTETELYIVIIPSSTFCCGHCLDFAFNISTAYGSNRRHRSFRRTFTNFRPCTTFVMLRYTFSFTVTEVEAFLK